MSEARVVPIDVIELFHDVTDTKRYFKRTYWAFKERGISPLEVLLHSLIVERIERARGLSIDLIPGGEELRRDLLEKYDFFTEETAGRLVRELAVLAGLRNIAFAELTRNAQKIVPVDDEFGEAEATSSGGGEYKLEVINLLEGVKISLERRVVSIFRRDTDIIHRFEIEHLILGFLTAVILDDVYKYKMDKTMMLNVLTSKWAREGEPQEISSLRTLRGQGTVYEELLFHIARFCLQAKLVKFKKSYEMDEKEQIIAVMSFLHTIRQLISQFPLNIVAFKDEPGRGGERTPTE